MDDVLEISFFDEFILKSTEGMMESAFSQMRKKRSIIFFSQMIRSFKFHSFELQVICSRRIIQISDFLPIESDHFRK